MDLINVLSGSRSEDDEDGDVQNFLQIWTETSKNSGWTPENKLRKTAALIRSFLKTEYPHAVRIHLIFGCFLTAPGKVGIHHLQKLITKCTHGLANKCDNFHCFKINIII